MVIPMKERRRFPRYNCSFDVNYSTIGVASIESRSVIKDISRSGVKLPVSRVVKKGDVVNLDIYTNPDLDPFLARGRVKWIREDSSDSGPAIEAGIEFMDIRDHAINRLLLMSQ